MNEFEMLSELCSVSTIAGRESVSEKRIIELASPFFDEYYRDSFGSLVFVKKSKIKDAPRLLLDAHLDEVGFMVSDIHDGFLSVVPIGGIDARVLPATEVIVYGKREIKGVFSSVPPHLLGKNNASVPKVEELYVDVGLKKSELEELVSKGDAVGYMPCVTRLFGDRVVSKGLDDKACVCAILDMACRAESDKLQYDLYAIISAQEETGKNGARLCAYDIKPDIAIVTDVNFARGEGIEACESIEIGRGASVDISSMTDISLTRGIMRLLDSKNIPYQKICEPMRTGTNNDLLSISAQGVRTALLSIPLEAMHTPSEMVSLSDIKSLSSILLELAYTPKEEL